MRLIDQRWPLRVVIACTALTAITTPAGPTFVDKDAFNKERIMWEGMAATNKIFAAEISDLQKEVTRLEEIDRANIDLRARAETLDDFVSGILSNSFMEWHRESGQPFLAKVTGDDGQLVEMISQDGRTGRVDRAKLAEADVTLLNLLKAYQDSAKATTPTP